MKSLLVLTLLCLFTQEKGRTRVQSIVTVRKSDLLISCSSSNCKSSEWTMNGKLIHNNSNLERFGNNGLFIKSIEYGGKYECICKIKNGRIHYMATEVKVVECESEYKLDPVEVSCLFLLAAFMGMVIGLSCSYQKTSLSLFHRC
ncbi:protein ORF54 [Goose adenovirus 4]|nr:protein ORF54 [Goose adenovirus 4]